MIEYDGLVRYKGYAVDIPHLQCDFPASEAASIGDHDFIIIVSQHHGTSLPEEEQLPTASCIESSVLQPDVSASSQILSDSQDVRYFPPHDSHPPCKE